MTTDSQRTEAKLDWSSKRGRKTPAPTLLVQGSEHGTGTSARACASRGKVQVAIERSAIGASCLLDVRAGVGSRYRQRLRRYPRGEWGSQRLDAGSRAPSSTSSMSSGRLWGIAQLAQLGVRRARRLERRKVWFPLLRAATVANLTLMARRAAPAGPVEAIGCSFLALRRPSNVGHATLTAGPKLQVPHRRSAARARMADRRIRWLPEGPSFGRTSRLVAARSAACS
jgi:hypothetical protein